MGGLTSKHVEEAVKTSGTQDTPKQTHVLSADPRSPSDYITRTPISVMDTPDGDRNGTCTPQDGKVLRVLELDPRSPISEVNRTPIVVETKTHRRPCSLKPSRLAQLESFTSCGEEGNDSDDQDPRSPTTKVPRTPLEEKVHAFSNSESEQKCGSDINEDHEIIENGEETKEGSEIQDKSKIMKPLQSEESANKVRRPLISLQNTTTNNTPRGLLQAKQCRSVEEEYNKNQQIILGQLSTQEKTVVSNTQFVESI
ncbi:uncharacterized protein [Panulirus ornatus]|uniref:uncharacterized protein n=1 Tax=Panulirus ornatus TaxID=150431 RepID=UPI003A85C2B5